MEKELNIGTQSLLGYLPALLIKNILEEKINMNDKLPLHTTINTVSLFADISGFTKLSESFSKKGRIGPEFLAFSLNRYMEKLINIIGKNGGDIFKFAGDALFVIWPEEKDNLSHNCKRAIQCAFEIQKHLHNSKVCNGKDPLSIKIGIGVGECKILIVGGFFKRCEYLTIGKAVRDACMCEVLATEGGETIITEEVLKEIFDFIKVDDRNAAADNHYNIDPNKKFYLVKNIIGEKLNIKSETYLIRTRFSKDNIRKNVNTLRQFIPASITLYLDIEKEFWSREIRMLSIMFLNLKFDMDKSKESVNKMANDLILKVQRCVYRTRGGLNKFLMDDKGTLMLLCWGLPPLSNTDDHLRGVLSALSLMNDLKNIDCKAFMSLTTGTCFTGVCGTLGNRREYSLLGEVVNLSARFMQNAMENSNGKKFLFLIDETTKKLIENKIHCKYYNEFTPKGFSISFKTFVPILYEEKTLYKYFIQPFKYNPFPEIKTHKFNPVYLDQIHDEKALNEDHAKESLKDSLFIVNRNENLRNFVNLLQDFYINKTKSLILIKGPIGSGKSLFLRRGFYEFLKQNKNFHDSIFSTNKKRIMFCTFQTPITIKKPYNAFYKIFREMFNYLSLFYEERINMKTYNFVKMNSNLNIKDETSSQINNNLRKFSEEIINIIIEEKCFNLLKFLEIILKQNLLKLFENKYRKTNENINAAIDNFNGENLITFNKTCGSYVNTNNNEIEDHDKNGFDFEKEKEELILPEPFDNYFNELKFMNYTQSKKINNFFLRLIKLYQEIILEEDITSSSISFFNKDCNSTIGEHLIFVLEDCHRMDSLSIEFFKCLITESIIQNVTIVFTHQESLFMNIEDKENKFSKNPEFFREDVHIFHMNNILIHDYVSKLMKFAILKSHKKNDKVAISKIETDLIDIIISKSFKGNPLFIYEITDNLLHSKKLIQHLSTEILVTSELLEMVEFNNWGEFRIPILIERLVGSMIDSLNLKQIILLKLASIIGNIFDIRRLMEINEFQNLNLEDMYALLKNLEQNGILEFLYDINKKDLICKFGIPFFREILYQRMLIEQKNEYHLKVAQTYQNPKLRYYSNEKEVKILAQHLKNSERTLLVQMEEDESVQETYYKMYQNNMQGGNNLNKYAIRFDDTEMFNITNLKIFLVKDIVQKIRNIENSLTIKNIGLDDEKNDKSLQLNKSLQRIISGILEKKSDKKITWENRFCVITVSKFLYWYIQEDYLQNKVSLGCFLLCNILDISILQDFHFGSKKNIVCIYLSSWIKKNDVKSSRRFYFSFATREEMYKWSMTLNFLRVKAIHDDFCLKFGILNLPLKHEMKKTLKNKTQKRLKLESFSLIERNSETYANLKNGESLKMRKMSIDLNKIGFINRRLTNYSISRFSSINMEEIEKNNNEIILDLKKNLKYIFEKCIPCFIFCIQHTIFNYEDDFDCFETNLIKIPENYYLIIDKDNNESKITYGNDHLSKSLILDISKNNSPKNSNASFSNIADKIAPYNDKIEEKVFQINQEKEFNHNSPVRVEKETIEIKSIENYKKNINKSKIISHESQKLKLTSTEYAIENQVTKEIFSISEKDSNLLSDVYGLKEENNMRKKINYILNKNKEQNENHLEKNYEKILKTVQNSAFLNIFSNIIEEETQQKGSSQNYRKNIKTSQTLKSTEKNKDKVAFNLKDKKDENNKNYGRINSEKISHTTINNNFFINFNEKQKNVTEFIPNKTNYKNNHKKCKFLKNKSMENSINLDDKFQLENNHEIKDELFSENEKIDYYKMYNLKKTTDSNSFFEFFDPSRKIETKTNKESLKEFNDVGPKHQINLITKLKDFDITMPNDDDIFDIKSFKDNNSNEISDSRRKINSIENYKVGNELKFSQEKHQEFYKLKKIEKDESNKQNLHNKIYANIKSNIFDELANLENKI